MKKKIQINFLITYFLMAIITTVSAATYTYPVNKNKETYEDDYYIYVLYGMAV